MGNELPKGWKIVPLKEITSIIRGVSYPKEEAKLHPEEDCVHILRGGNIQDGKIVLDTDDAFPGIGDEEKITISFGNNLICL